MNFSLFRMEKAFSVQISGELNETNFENLSFNWEFNFVTFEINEIFPPQKFLLLKYNQLKRSTLVSKPCCLFLLYLYFNSTSVIILSYYLPHFLSSKAAAEKSSESYMIWNLSQETLKLHPHGSSFNHPSLNTLPFFRFYRIPEPFKTSRRNIGKNFR